MELALATPTEQNSAAEISPRWRSSRIPKVRMNMIRSLMRLALRIKDRRHAFYDPVKGDSYPEVLYEDVMAKDEAMLQWLENIVCHQGIFPSIQLSHSFNADFSQWNWGFCFVKGVPVNPESTKALIERIAFIRHTHYGISVYLTDMPGH